MKWVNKQLLFGMFLSTVVLSVGCNKTDDDKMTVEHLPSLSLNSISDCVENAPNGKEMTWDEWRQSGDGIVYGTIVDIQPALDQGIAFVPDEKEVADKASMIRDEQSCLDITGALRVRLALDGGFLQDDSTQQSLTGAALPKELDLYFGSTMADVFHAYTPIVRDGNITWGEKGPAISKGMVIGGVAFYNDIVDKWSLISPIGQQPLFDIVDNQIHFQEGTATSEMCDARVPVSLLDGYAIDTLDELVEVTQREGTLWVDRTSRTLSIQNEEEAVRWVRGWIGECITQEYLDLRDKDKDGCQVSNDCQQGEQCIDGACVE